MKVKKYFLFCAHIPGFSGIERPYLKSPQVFPVLTIVPK